MLKVTALLMALLSQTTITPNPAWSRDNGTDGHIGVCRTTPISGVDVDLPFAEAEEGDVLRGEGATQFVFASPAAYRMRLFLSIQTPLPPARMAMAVTLRTDAEHDGQTARALGLSSPTEEDGVYLLAMDVNRIVVDTGDTLSITVRLAHAPQRASGTHVAWTLPSPQSWVEFVRLPE